MLSGSGPSCVFLADGEPAAYALRSALHRTLGALPGADPTTTHERLLVVNGPAPGARVEETN